MRKSQKDIAFLGIVSIGFILVLLLWLPTFVISLKKITQEANVSTSQFSGKFQEQSDELFSDTGKKIQEKLQAIEEEKQKQDSLHAKITDILKEAISPTSTIPLTP